MQLSVLNSPLFPVHTDRGAPVAKDKALSRVWGGCGGSWCGSWCWPRRGKKGRRARRTPCRGRRKALPSPNTSSGNYPSRTNTLSASLCSCASFFALFFWSLRMPSIPSSNSRLNSLPPLSPPPSVEALGGRRSQLVDALSDPTAQDKLYLLNEMARIHLVASFAEGGGMAETGPEDTILEGAGILGSGSTRASAAAARAREEDSPLFYGWASRLLKQENGGKLIGGWLLSLWGEKKEEEGRELFFASLPRPAPPPGQAA